MSRFLSIDLGTTLFKFAIFDDRGSLLSLARVKPPIDHPQPGRWEIPFQRFRSAVAEGIAELQQQVGLSEIVAISFATQANSFVLLDRADEPLSPIILWPDERAADFEAEIQQASASADFRVQTGIPSLSHQFAVAKLLHLRKEKPGLFRQSSRLFFISDLLSYLFTRQHVTEAGMAALSGAVDIRTLTWRRDALSLFGLDQLTLPKIVRAGTDLGVIDPGIATEFGLPADCRFVVGCLDQYAGMIGTGSVSPGALSETTGTVLAAVRCTHHVRSDSPPDVFAGPSFDPDLFYEMSFSSTSANLLEHYRNTLPDRPEFTELTALAESATSGDCIIEPFQAGQTIENSFRNVTASHSRGQIVRAIMECVARQCAAQIRSLCGSDLPPRVNSAGGGARSALWLKIKSETLGVPFVATACEEPTSLGAAMLAASAIGGKRLDELAKTWVRTA